ncbi:MAG TPA: C13 family peptidase [Burkholderiales bacterium]
MRFYLACLLKNVLAGIRLAFFLPVRALDFRASAADFTLLIALDFVLWVLAAAVRARFEGEFDPSVLPTYLAGVPLVLATALAVALAYRQPSRLMLIAVALVASDPVFEVAGLFFPIAARSVGLGASALALYVAWAWVASLRAVRVTAGTQRPQWYIGAAAVSAMVAIGFFAFPQVEPWTQAADEDADAPLADERLFHIQGELIESALASITRGRAGVPETYFVGFAPDGSQDVFLKEMRFVKQLFDERFGTAGRSVALVSSETALEEFPIATATNLSRVLARVGEAMNPEEDTLFLFLSAHGGPDHRLSAWQPPLEVAQLSPTALARMLQDAGIKWRVIVVSACYAGGFIEPLRDDNSVVITAAASDRTSFGCEAGRDFTYFGEAYFREALAQTRSFVRAFDIAKDIVAKAEAREKLAPSQPQIFVGSAIARRLEGSQQEPREKR